MASLALVCYVEMAGAFFMLNCLVSYDHISQRIQKLATAREVLGNLLADLKAQTS